jgi:hypothetical protein
MQHPDLEQQLAELKAERQEATQALRDLASEALGATDKVNKSITMFLKTDCDDGECVDCTCKPKRKTSRHFNGKKLRKKINGANSTKP